jgi:ribosomal peptide maturation radical SAM protein 1
MRVLLVNMPWSPIDLPSLALGILKRSVNEQTEGQAEVLHANLEYVDWITRTKPEFCENDYSYYALASYFVGCGDWVFSSALYDDPQWRVDEFTHMTKVSVSKERQALSVDLHRSAPDFVQMIAEKIVAAQPDLVGFTSTFQQNTAALAAAKYVKRLAPQIITVMGGANCDGEQGESLHRNFPFVDYVLRGESEVSFPELLNRLAAGADLGSIPSLCHRVDGRSVVNPMRTAPLPPTDIMPPDYDGYFERLATSVAGSWVEPKLVVEGARGCWWGEKHHCTFCGLNGSSMQFRSKSPDVFLDEIIHLATRHRILDMYVVDNILDMGYISTVLPKIIAGGHDFRMHVEIKSNLKRAQLQTLADAGLIYVQPGIESLNSRVLDLMDKGVSGPQNIRMLRDGQTTGLSVAWNYLHGFPDESEDDYAPIIAQMPVLEHLEPPVDLSARIAIERFSPYFNQPERGFSDLKPSGSYRMTYDLPEPELYDLAYIFEAPERGIGKDFAKVLNDGLKAWHESYPSSRLTYHDGGDRIVLVNRRRVFTWETHQLRDPLEIALFRLLDQPHNRAALTRKAGRVLRDATVSDEAVAQVLAHFQTLGLVFVDGGHYVQVASEARNQDLLRLDFMRLAHETSAPPRTASGETASEGTASEGTAVEQEPAGRPTPIPA